MNDNCEKLVDNANLWAENQKLQSNWNSLREWLEKRKQDLNGDYDYDGNYREDIIVLDKMNELEGKDKE